MDLITTFVQPALISSTFVLMIFTIIERELNVANHLMLWAVFCLLLLMVSENYVTKF